MVLKSKLKEKVHSQKYRFHPAPFLPIGNHFYWLGSTLSVCETQANTYTRVPSHATRSNIRWVSAL